MVYIGKYFLAVMVFSFLFCCIVALFLLEVVLDSFKAVDLLVSGRRLPAVLKVIIILLAVSFVGWIGSKGFLWDDPPCEGLTFGIPIQPLAFILGCVSVSLLVALLALSKAYEGRLHW
ncbi:MAG: hypothetical protein WC107_06685 [Patescibacteria group bacterium]